MKEDKSKYEKFRVVPCRTKKRKKTTEKNLPVQVVYAVNDKIHLYHEKVAVRITICSLYKCGTPTAPTKYAHFCSTWDAYEQTEEWERLCGTCYTGPYLSKLPSRGPIRTTGELAMDMAGPNCFGDDSTSGSEVSSSASSLSDSNA